MADVVEYTARTPGWRGTWPDRGDRGIVLASDGGVWLLVRWRLRYDSTERDVWTHRDCLRSADEVHDG